MKHEETAKRLKIALKERGMIPQELADYSGVNKSSISQYINGSHKPSNLSAGKMASVLRVSPLWLMGFDAPKEAKSTDDSIDSRVFQLSSVEKNIVTNYRAADPGTQKSVRKLLDIPDQGAAPVIPIKKESSSDLMPIAAHKHEGATPEELAEDVDMVENDKI